MDVLVCDVGVGDVVGGGFAVPRHPTRRSKTQYTVAEMMHGRKVELLNAG